jgi:hypothetical protein
MSAFPRSASQPSNLHLFASEFTPSLYAQQYQTTDV